MKKLLVLSVLGFSLLLTNCNKDNKEKFAPLKIKYSFNYGKADFQLNSPNNYEVPQKIVFSELSFYVTNIKLYTANNEMVDLSDSPQLFTPDNNWETSIPKIPLGTYTKIELGFGVPENINTQNGKDAIIATDYPHNSPLNPATNMYWNWANGYIFSKIEGKIDTDGNGSFTDTQDLMFSYHPGNDDLYRTVTLIGNFELKDMDNNVLTLGLDILQLIAAADFHTTPFAHPVSNSGVEFEACKNLVNQWQSATSIK